MRGSVHNPVLASLKPRKMTLPSYITSHFVLSNVTVQPASHNGRIPINDAIARCGTMCPVKTCGKPGIVISHTCVDLTFLPSGKLIVSGFVAGLLFTTSTPSIIKIDVAPVSAIACVVAIAMALRYSDVCFPKILRAAAASDVGMASETCGGWEQGDVQLDVGTVASSSSMTLNE